MINHLMLDGKMIANLSHALAENLFKAMAPVLERHCLSMERIAQSIESQAKDIRTPEINTKRRGTSVKNMDISVPNIDLELLGTQIYQLTGLDYQSMRASGVITADQLEALEGIESLLVSISDLYPVEASTLKASLQTAWISQPDHRNGTGPDQASPKAAT